MTFILKVNNISTATKTRILQDPLTTLSQTLQNIEITKLEDCKTDVTQTFQIIKQNQITLILSPCFREQLWNNRYQPHDRWTTEQILGRIALEGKRELA